LFQGPTDGDTVRAVAACEVPPARAYNRGATHALETFLRDILAPSPDDRTPTAALAVAQLEALRTALDPTVGDPDVALLVGLHLASEPPRPSSTPQGLAELLAQELAAFAEAALVSEPLGATPLDPDAFLTDRRG
jgi:serine/threonine-protein kinase